MTLGEFKAWFDGFCENVVDKPNSKQWMRICERVKEIDDKPVTEHIIERWYDRYVYPYMSYYPRPYPGWTTSVTIPCSNAVGSSNISYQNGCDNSVGFTPTVMLTNLGRNESATLMQ